MAGRDGRYPNNKVGFEQNNNNSASDRLFCDSDGYFNFAGDNNGGDVTGDQLCDALYKPLQVLRPSMANTQSLTEKFLQSTIGVVIFSTTSNWTYVSFWLDSCVIGRKVTLITKIGSTTGASGRIWVSTSGCTLIGHPTLGAGAAISGFFIRTSSNSQVCVKLECFTDGEWSVTEAFGGYAEA